MLVDNRIRLCNRFFKRTAAALEIRYSSTFFNMVQKVITLATELHTGLLFVVDRFLFEIWKRAVKTDDPAISYRPY